MNLPAERLNLCQGTKLLDAASQTYSEEKKKKNSEISYELIAVIIIERKDLFFVH